MWLQQARSQSLQLFCIFHRIQLNLDWRSTYSHSLRHTHTLTHSHTKTQWGKGEMLIKWTGSNVFVALRCAAACATFAALHYTGYPPQLPLPFLPLLNLPQPHVAALSAARQCCCAKHNLALHTFERLFWRNYITSTQPTAKTRKKTNQASCVNSTASIPYNGQLLLNQILLFFCKAVSVCRHKIM